MPLSVEIPAHCTCTARPRWLRRCYGMVSTRQAETRVAVADLTAQDVLDGTKDRSETAEKGERFDTSRSDIGPKAPIIFWMFGSPPRNTGGVLGCVDSTGLPPIGRGPVSRSTCHAIDERAWFTLSIWCKKYDLVRNGTISAKYNPQQKAAHMNPFRPTAGKMPPILIGRESDLADFFQGLRDGAGAPGRLMLITGQRGFGKTVLLTEFGRIARAEGWPVVSETASEGVCARIIDALEVHSPRVSGVELNPSVNIAGVAGVSVGRLSVERGVAARSLRLAIEHRLKQVEPGKGLFISVDEVQAATRQDMIDIGTAIQHVIRDQDLLDVPDSKKKGVAFAFAGLPSVVDELLDDKVLTFLRRSQRHVLAEVGIPDVRNALVQTIHENGKYISEALALRTAESTMGFPYMVQLLGHYLWQSSDVRHSDAIEDEDLARAIPDAARAFEDAVCAPAFRGLSKAQRRFVLAMLDSQKDASVPAEIAKRAQRSEAWVRKYRQSLYEAHVVCVNGDGSVSFSIPYFASYLRRVVV